MWLILNEAFHTLLLYAVKLDLAKAIWIESDQSYKYERRLTSFFHNADTVKGVMMSTSEGVKKYITPVKEC